MAQRPIRDELEKKIRELENLLEARADSESEIREYKERYEQLLNHAPAGIFEFDFDSGRFVSVNDVMIRYSGYTREELLSMKVIDLFTADTKSISGTGLQKLLAGEKIEQDAEYKVIAKNGREFWVYLNAKFIYKKEKPTGGQVVIYDITRRKLAEDALHESEAKYRNLVERAQDGIVILHREKLVYVNPCFAKLTGYQVHELEGRSAAIIIPPELQPSLRERYKRRLKGENELTIYESQLMHREGRRIDVEFNIGVIRYLGEPANLTIVRDITERKRIEKERIQAEKRLRYLSSRLLKSQESERKRLSNELHDELGQSLALLKHMLRSANKSSPGPRPSPATSIDESIVFVDHIIENLRRISKDLSPTILEDLGLTAALQWALDNFSRKNAIETFIRMGDIDNLYSAEVNVNIYRIIQESLSNIGKHARAEHVSVTARRKKGSVSFTIEDDGRGFELGQVKIDNFARSGMGLDIMTERARMIGASIEIESAPGKGTRIRLHIPSRLHL